MRAICVRPGAYNLTEGKSYEVEIPIEHETCMGDLSVHESYVFVDNMGSRTASYRHRFQLEEEEWLTEEELQEAADKEFLKDL